MPPTPCALGLDLGTNTVRALIADLAAGGEIAAGVAAYEHGEAGVIGDPTDPHLARQHPADYETALAKAVKSAVEQARAESGFEPRSLCGIGIAATASTPLAIDGRCRPLALDERFSGNPAALAWLWKDHTAHAEAEEITALAREEMPEVLARCGGVYSSEWLFSKLLRCARTAPEVLEAAEAWVELGDHVAGLLTGCSSPAAMVRNACAAGHKGLHHEERGWPPASFCERLDARLGRWWKARQPPRALPPGERAGGLSAEWAARLGLEPGTPVAAATIDAHAGAVGAGIRPGVLVKILGTSACDLLVHPVASGPPPQIPGLSGIVRDSIVPGCWGIEAGQAAVGDLFGWFVRELGAPAGLTHEILSAQAAALAPGASGLLALDWNNGNRSLLADPLLSGCWVGLTLRTRPHEIYRALIEATAFGARMIIDQVRRHGVEAGEIVACGGIAEKNPLLLEIYASVLGAPLKLSRARETCALGAAIFGAVAAGAERGGWATLAEAQASMTGTRPQIYTPRTEDARIYGELHELYGALHDAFGAPGREPSLPLHHVMKRLLEIQRRC